MIGTWFSLVSGGVGRLSASTRGAVAVIGALSLTTIVGMGAFAVEATRGYAAKQSNQRIADMAALAGALAYNVNSDSAQMIATAKAVAAAQGVSASAVDVALVTDAASAQQLVEVSVTTQVPLQLGRVFSSALSYEVESVGAATTMTTASVTPPCIAALSGTPTYGVTMSGGTMLNAPGCAVSTNAGVTVTGGARITTQQVNAGKTVNIGGGASITTSPTANNVFANKAGAASDWFSADVKLMAMLCQVNLLTGYSDPAYAGGNRACTSELVLPTTATTSGAADWKLGYRPKSDGGIHAWQTADYSCNYVVPAGTYTIGELDIPGGCQISFANGSTIKIDDVDMNGSALSFGNGDVTIVDDFNFNSGSTVTFGNGKHSFGSISLSGGRTLSIGSGDLNVTEGIKLAGGSNIYVASGVGDRIAIGNDGGPGRAIELAGGSRVCFTASCGTPTVPVTTFSLNGDVKSAGGSTVVFPKATTHVVNGDIDLNGSSIFGSGTYIVAGDISNNTGGTLAGADVSFALGGTFTLSGGTSLDIAAPNALSSYGVPGILIATKSSSDTRIGGGSANKYAGLLYAPNSDMTISGGGAISTNGSACLMMIVNTLTLSGGGNASTGACSSLTTSGTTANVALFR